jgi:regulator of RNase E activity RraA
MINDEIRQAFLTLSTPQIADACLKLKLRVRTAPRGIRPVAPEMRLAGRVFPVRHYGSIDIILEAIDLMENGEVLVIDDGGRDDRACVGDTVAMEAHRQKAFGMAIWGSHRDTSEIRDIGFPVFSYGPCPNKSLTLEARPDDALVAAHFGQHIVTQMDVVFGDEDGVIFVAYPEIENVIEIAQDIYRAERQRVLGIHEGRSLREQYKFYDYLEKRKQNPDYTFNQHLQDLSDDTK